MNNLTIDGEFRYIIQWFNEWSELQRDDFVPILVNYLTDAHNNEDDDTVGLAAATTPVNMNGLPNDLEFNGRPMSLFQCRVSERVREGEKTQMKNESVMILKKAIRLN